MVGNTRKIQVDSDTEYQLPGTDGSDGQFLKTNGSGITTWATAEGGGGGTGKNYITNPDAETDTTGYATYADAAAVTPVDGTGGSATTTFTRNTSSPLTGDADFVITKDAANRQGEGVGYNFSIDNADKAKKHLISFDYSTSANYADDDVKVFIYDVTNTSLIRVSGEDLKAVSGSSTHYAQFQTASDSTSYRLIIHVSSTNASAYTVNLDTIQVGPIQANTNASLNGQDVILVRSHTTGTSIPNNTQTVIPFDSADVDTTNSWDAVNYKYVVPETGYYDIDAKILYNATSLLDAGEYCNMELYVNSVVKRVSDVFESDLTSSVVRVWAQQINTCMHLNKGDEVQFKTYQNTGSAIPLHATASSNYLSIAKRQSASSVTPGASGRDVVFHTKGLTGHLAISEGTDTKITTWNAPASDTVGGWDSANDKYVIPETGYYDLGLSVHISDEAATEQMTRVSSRIYVDGAAAYRTHETQHEEYSNGNSWVTALGVHLTKGQEIEFYTRYDGGDASNNVNSVATLTYASVVKRQSAQTALTTSEEIIFIRSHETGTTIANSTWTVVPWDGLTRNIDTANAWDSTNHKYVAPETGYYDVDYHVLTDPTADLDAGEYGYSALYVNGAIRAQGIVTESDLSSSVSVFYNQDLSTIVHLNKGDEVQIKIHQNSGAAMAIQANNHNNYISIAKRGAANTYVNSDRVVAMSCGQTSTQTIADDTETTVIFNSSEFDTHSGLDTSTGAYTIPVAGIYQINAKILFDPTANWDGGELGYVRINAYDSSGVEKAEKTGHVTEWQTSNSVSIYLSSQVTCLLSLNKGDVVKVNVTQKTGSSLDLANAADDTYFDLHRLS